MQTDARHHVANHIIIIDHTGRIFLLVTELNMNLVCLVVALVVWRSAAADDYGRRRRWVRTDEDDKRMVFGNNDPTISMILSRLDDLGRKNAQLEAKLDALIHDPVAFKVHLTKPFYPSNNQHIIFDDIEINLGHAYDDLLGRFTAPYNGTYVLSSGICAPHGYYIVVDMKKNADIIAPILAGDDAYSDCNSVTMVTDLHIGDHVYLQHHGITGSRISASEFNYDYFSGSLLQAHGMRFA